MRERYESSAKCNMMLMIQFVGPSETRNPLQDRAAKYRQTLPIMCTVLPDVLNLVSGAAYMRLVSELRHLVRHDCEVLT